MATSFQDAAVVVTSRSFSSGDYDATGALESEGLRVVRADTGHHLDRITDDLSSAVAWIAGTSVISAEHLDAAPKLQLIARYGVGVDSVDLEAAADHGVAVTNTPNASTDAVADLTIGLMLSALRSIPAGDRKVRQGDWSTIRGKELGSTTVGVLGFGRIGQAVARRLSGFGCRVIAHDPWLDPSVIREAGVEPAASALDVARESDVVTVHTPGGAAVITADWLAHCRQELVLVNAARATAVDESAVVDAVRDGRIRSYATDTPANEHVQSSSALLAGDLADRTIVTPHLGAQTVDAVDRMGRGTVEAVLALVRGLPLPNRVTA
jgi:D-3-phosphoglycerate dehydrogenase